MRVVKQSGLNQIRNDDNKQYDVSLNKDVNNIIDCLSKRVTFIDNIACESVAKSDTGTANTEFSVSHTLGVIPTGFLVYDIDKGGVVYKSTTAWTSTTVYFKCSAANAAVSIYLLKE